MKHLLTFSPDKAPESPQEIFNRLTAVDEINQYLGTWIFMRGNRDEAYPYFLSVSFINNNALQQVSAKWGIESHTTGNLRLANPEQEFSEDTRIMILEKE